MVFFGATRCLVVVVGSELRQLWWACPDPERERACSPFYMLGLTVAVSQSALIYTRKLLDHEQRKIIDRVYILQELGLIMQFIQECYISFESGNHGDYFMLSVFKIAS